MEIVEVVFKSCSRGAAKESSPRRQSWDKNKKRNQAPAGAKECFGVGWLTVAPAGAFGLRAGKPTAVAVGYYRPRLRR